MGLIVTRESKRKKSVKTNIEEQRILIVVRRKEFVMEYLLISDAAK